MSALKDKKCVPCKTAVMPLGINDIERFKTELNDWQVVQWHHLSRRFTFADFAQGLDFVNRIGALAEAEDHHPDLFLSWGQVRVDIFTHKINGLSENDFVLAAKIDGLPQQLDENIMGSVEREVGI